jgi:hypothetical protein
MSIKNTTGIEIPRVAAGDPCRTISLRSKYSEFPASREVFMRVTYSLGKEKEGK